MSYHDPDRLLQGCKAILQIVLPTLDKMRYDNDDKFTCLVATNVGIELISLTMIDLTPDRKIQFIEEIAEAIQKREEYNRSLFVSFGVIKTAQKSAGAAE